MTEHAWMIRNDGVAVPCIQHIYANTAEPDETLYAAQWLYQNTRNEQNKFHCLQLIKSYGLTLGRNNFFNAILNDITAKPYIFLTAPFIRSIHTELEKATHGDVNTLSVAVEKNLNQEFLRARYGGLYHTDKQNKGMYFRISSENFNWYSHIYDFLKCRQDAIKTVTIVRDEESTGIADYFYTAPNGQLYDALPLSLFWSFGKHNLI